MGELDKVLAREGGYVNHPKDKGGPTKYGVTLQTLSNWRGRAATSADVAKLTPDEAKTILRAGFAAPFDFMPSSRLKSLLIDSSVQHGPQDAIRWLQGAAGATRDGRLGEETISAVRASNEADLYDAVLAARLRKLHTLSQTPRGKVFAKGWENRIKEFL